MSVKLEDARRVIAAAEKKAKEIAQPMNIAVADEPYALAQDAASAIRTFIGECYYDTTKGLPYFEKVFVMAEDEGLRRNRLALLKQIHGSLAGAFADLYPDRARLTAKRTTSMAIKANRPRMARR